MNELLIIAVAPLAAFIAGIFLGLKLAPTPPAQSQPVVIVTGQADTSNSWPDSLDTNNQN